MHNDLTITAIATNTVSFVVAALRIAGVKTEAYQAVAHLWVGGIAGAWLINRDRGLLVQFVALCVVELGCFGYGIYESRQASKNGKPPAIDP